MNYKDALNMFFERSNAMQTFWNFHITIILALIAFFASIRPNPNLRILKVFVTGAFIAFAIVNLLALTNVADQRLKLVQVFHTLSQSAVDKAVTGVIAPTLDPPAIWQVCVVHIMGDALTVGAIWLLAAKKQREASVRAEVRL
jgi:hypothetical protein